MPNKNTEEPMPVARGATAATPSRPAPRRKRPRHSSGEAADRHHLKHYALLSLSSFCAGLLLLWLLLVKAELLVQLGIEGRLYYLVLLPLGLAVSTFLFGVLRSFALYRGKVLGGLLELGGPVVGFGLVILGGFWLPPSPAPFAVTVFVHGEGELQDIPLRGQGHVLLDLGPDRRREAIGNKGEAYFPGIPASFRNKDVLVGLEAEGFVLANPGVKRRLAGSSLYLAVKRIAASLQGRIQNPEGLPIAGAILRLRGLSTRSAPDGFFRFEIPGIVAHDNLTLSVAAPGYQPWDGAVVSDSNAVVVVLRPAAP